MQTGPAPIRSVARIGQHPIHPLLIPFPIAFLVAALGTDATYWVTRDIFWARASMWLLGAGVVSGGIAALAGLTDFVFIKRAQSLTGWTHWLGNTTIVGLSLFNMFWRVGDWGAAVLPWGVTMSSIAAGMLMVTGWLGASLAHVHRISIGGRGAVEPQEEIRRPRAA